MLILRENPIVEIIILNSTSLLDSFLTSFTNTPFSFPQVHIPLDPSTKQSKGLAYVTFAQPSCALGAYEALDRKSFQGRLLHVLAAVNRKGKMQVEEGDGIWRNKTVKDEREGKRKAMAGREFNWGMLYMNVSLPYCNKEPVCLSLSCISNTFRATRWLHP